jgi:hypothetical protein
MSAPPPLPAAAIRCQIARIVAYAQRHDSERLWIRCALRDALLALERPERREPIRLAPPGGAP